MLKKNELDHSASMDKTQNGTVEILHGRYEVLVVYYQELSLLSRSNTLTPLTLIYDHINRTLTISDVIKLLNECHQWHSLTISSAIKPLNECHQSTF